MRSRIAGRWMAVCVMAAGIPLSGQSQAATPLFGPERAIPVTWCGNSPTAEALTTGDFTGDGVVDVAMTDLCGFGVRVLPGRGDGSFEADRFVWSGFFPDALTSADLDGDGARDLIVANAIGDMVTLYGDGSGNFIEQGRYWAQGFAPGATRVADFNNDGRLDFAVAATPSTVFLNTGGRGFAGQTLLTGLASVGLEVADFDADGNTDVVVASGFPVVLNVLYGNGNGSFGRNHTLLAPDLIQEAIRVADVNNDGRPDVVGVTSIGGLNVWLGSDQGLRPSNWTIGSIGNAGLALADLDDDGDIDLVTADSVQLRMSVYRGDGTGRFQWIEAHFAPASVESVEFVDLNGDGKLDMITAPMVGPWLSTYLHT